MVHRSEKLQHTVHNCGKKPCPRIQKYNHDGPVSALVSSEVKSHILLFFLLSFLFFFISGQKSSGRSYQPCYKVKRFIWLLLFCEISLVHCCENQNSLKNCSFHFLSASISLGTTREASWLVGRKLWRFLGIEVHLIVKFRGFFCRRFLFKKKLQLTQKCFFFLILLRIGCLQQKEALWLIAAL